MRSILIRCVAVAALITVSPAGAAAAWTNTQAASAAAAQVETSPTPSPEASPTPGDDLAIDGSGGRIPLPLGLLLFSVVLSAGLVVGKLRVLKR